MKLRERSHGHKLVRERGLPIAPTLKLSLRTFLLCWAERQDLGTRKYLSRIFCPTSLLLTHCTDEDIEAQEQAGKDTVMD